MNLYLKVQYLIKVGLTLTFIVLFFNTDVWQETLVSVVGILVTFASLISDKVNKEILSDIAGALTFITAILLVVLTKDAHAKIMYVSFIVIYNQLLALKEEN